MRQSKVYIETSVFNFPFSDDAPDKRDDALEFFCELRQRKYAPYTSEYVLRELQRAPESKRAAMFELLKQHEVIILPASNEAEVLAQKYVAERIIPEKYGTDAVHIAVASVNDLDFIVSYNFKHIVKRKTVTMTEAVNLKEGYRRIGIFSPTEVIDNGG